MKDWLNKILMDKAKEGDGGGAPKDPPKDDPAPPPSNDTPPKEGGDNLDELGYEKRAPEDKKEGDKSKDGDDKKKDPPKEPEKVANPATGYGDEPPKVEEPPPKKEETPPPAPTDIEKKLEGLAPQFQEQIKKQIADLGLEGEKADKLIAYKKDEQRAAIEWQKNSQAEAVRQEKLRNASWHKELKEDPVFGGEKFLVNVSRGEKVLDEYLSEFKKELTDAKQMLRPSVMRGLARLADRLYPDDKVVHGEPVPLEGGKDGKDEKNDPLSFYE